MENCKATTKGGAPCKATAQAGSDVCFFHDPTKTKERRASKVKGGKSGKLATLAAVKPWRGLDPVVLQSPDVEELVALLADTIDDVRVGALDPRIANSVGYLTGIILKAKEYEALNERLAAIEEALGSRQ
jgi:hypothetical protein